jgi:hypothetical protein
MSKIHGFAVDLAGDGVSLQGKSFHAYARTCYAHARAR